MRVRSPPRPSYCERTYGKQLQGGVFLAAMNLPQISPLSSPSRDSTQAEAILSHVMHAQSVAHTDFDLVPRLLQSWKLFNSKQKPWGSVVPSPNPWRQVALSFFAGGQKKLWQRLRKKIAAGDLFWAETNLHVTPVPPNPSPLYPPVTLSRGNDQFRRTSASHFRSSARSGISFRTHSSVWFG